MIFPLSYLLQQNTKVTAYVVVVVIISAVLYHKEVPFDNNGSERAFRIVKVKTKISGQFKALQHDFAVLRSVIDSVIKNGNSVFYAINAIVEMPPPPKAAG